MAGVVFDLTSRRETWHRFGVPMHEGLTTMAARVADRDEASRAARAAGLHRHARDIEVGDAAGVETGP